MSELGDIEAAVVGLIGGIESGGSPVFRSVGGFSDPDRRKAGAHVRGLTLPAAVVAYGGRLRGDTDGLVVGLPKLSVFVGVENLRGGEDVRVGDGEALGGFELLALLLGALDGVVIETDRRLSAIDESLAWSDETHAVYEQRYVVDRLAELTAPTFDGSAIAGSESIVRVVVGEVERESVSFGFPGVDGEFRHHLGVRGRGIRWEGQMRAASDSALNDIETTLEDFVRDGGAHDMVDAWSRTFGECVLDGYERKGPRRRHPVTGYALQDFVLRFVQLNP